MIRKNKPMIHFLENINQTIHCVEEEQKEYLIMKVVLLKWLIDNRLIQWDLVIEESLNKDFTFGNILYWWGNKKVNIMVETHHQLTPQERSALREILLGASVFLKEDSTILGEIYQYINHLSKRKKEGMFYTPFFAIEFMLKDKIKDWKPQDKIIDPACGCGFFLGVAYDKLINYYMENPDLLGTDKNKIHQRILENNLYGIEKNKTAAAVAKLVLLLKHKNLTRANLNIFCRDTLLDDLKPIENNSFRLVIGNPPYVGHKKLSKDYRLLISEKYREVFQDKGDLSYCFFQRGIELLKDEGELCYITSRYFLEALHGSFLREYILKHCYIEKIIDFYGQRILKGIQVDPLILSLRKKTQNKPKKNPVEVFRMKDIKENLSGKNILQSMISRRETPYIHHFYIDQNKLNKKGWRLLHPVAKNIINKIEEKSFYRLEELCESKQGIITGRDKAFVLDKSTAKAKNINKDFLKPWIKNKDIMPFYIEKSQKVLLYSSDIVDINKWVREKEHLLPHKPYLEKRRECLRGGRNWYDLQWSRDKSFFEGEKIIFPYKASSNRFALDDRGNFYSADIYGIRVKKDYEGVISNTTLTLLLNTRIYEFYFKGFAKKLGERLYEYYPNTLIQLSIPKWNYKEQKFLEDSYTLLMGYLEEGNNIKVKNIIDKVDQWLFDYFGFSQGEREHINNIEEANS